MNLHETQELFWNWATGNSAGDVGAVVEDTAAQTAEERIHVYAEMYRFRLVDALKEDFPKVWQILGPDAFEDLAWEYAQRHPSNQPSVSRFGRNFEKHLKAQAGLRTDLAELAALEWARAAVFEEANSPVSDVEVLRQLNPQTLPTTVLKFVPAFRFLRFEYDVCSLWQAVEEARPVPKPNPKKVAAAIWRKGFDIFHVELNEPEAAAVECAQKGGTVSDICEYFSNEEEPVSAALRAVTSWFHEGFIQKR